MSQTSLLTWHHADGATCSQVDLRHTNTQSRSFHHASSRCGRLHCFSFAYSFEAAIWASLPTSVVVCVSRCCGRRRKWQETLPDSENQKVLTDWPASSPAASEAWPPTCLLPWRSIWSSSRVDFLLMRTFADCQSGESVFRWCGGCWVGRKAVNKAEITWSPT